MFYITINAVPTTAHGYPNILPFTSAVFAICIVILSIYQLFYAKLEKATAFLAGAGMFASIFSLFMGA